MYPSAGDFDLVEFLAPEDRTKVAGVVVQGDIVSRKGKGERVKLRRVIGSKFFEENVARYEIPPRVIASYVEFPAANYLPGITVTAEEVRAYYDQNPARFPKPIRRQRF